MKTAYLRSVAGASALVLAFWVQTAGGQEMPLDPTPRCNAAKALIEAGHFDKAITILSETLADTKFNYLDCLNTHLLEAAQKKSALNQSNLEQFIRELTRTPTDNDFAAKILDSAASGAIATELLMEVRKAQAANYNKRIEQALKLDLTEEAETLMKEAAKAGIPIATPLGYEYADSGTIKSVSGVNRTLGKIWDAFEPWLVLALVLTIVLWMLWLWGFGRRAIILKPFESPSDHTSSGADAAAIIQAELETFSRSSGSGLEKMSRNDVPINVPTAALAALPSASLWSTLLRFLLQLIPTEKWLTSMLEGRIVWSPKKGTGLSLSFKPWSGPCVNEVVWSKDFLPPPADGTKANDINYGDASRLAEYAAIWLLFTAASTANGRFRGKISLKDELDTRDWHAFALFRSAARANEAGETAFAVRQYARSIKEAPDFRPSKINLAHMARMRALTDIGVPQVEYLRDRARRALTVVISQYEDREVAPRAPQKTYFSALYNLALLNYDSGHLEQALDQLKKIQVNIEKSLKSHESDENLSANAQRQVRYLDNLNIQAKIMRIGVDARVVAARLLEHASADDIAQFAEKKRAFEDVRTKSRDLPYHHYNLACSACDMATAQMNIMPTDGPSVTNGEVESYLNTALLHLEFAFWLDSDLAVHATDDLSFSILREHRTDQWEDLLQRSNPAEDPPAAETEVTTPTASITHS